MARFASGEYAKAICDRCGLTCKYTELRALVIHRQQTAVRVCRDCWETDHPQSLPPRVVADAEALRDPRPDNRAEGLTNIDWGWNPVFSLECTGEVGSVTVEFPT